MIPTDGTVTWHGAHPDNGVQKKGINYVGWDVFLTDQGMSLLEGSRYSNGKQPISCQISAEMRNC